MTGGYVYRGSLLGVAARGRYFFADFITSRVWSVQLTIAPGTGEATASDLVEHTGDLRAAASSPSSFGIDAAGELYIVNYSGTVYRLVSDTPTRPSPRPCRHPTTDQAGAGRRGRRRSASPYRADRPPHVPRT